MISFEQHLLLVLLGLLLIIINSIVNLIKYNSFEKRIQNFLQLLVFLFPLLDLKLPPSDFNIKLFESSIAIFSLFNFTSLMYLLKIYQNRFIWIFLFTMLLSALLSDFIVLSMLSVLRLAIVFLIFVFFKYVNEKGMNIFKKILFPIVLWLILFFIFQFIFGLQFSFYQNLNESALLDFRYTSFSQDPQKLAQIIFMLTSIFLVYYFQRRKLKSLRYLLLSLLLLFLGILTASRSPFLGFTISLIIFAFLNNTLKSFLYLIFIGAFFLLFIEWIIRLQIFQRMLEFDNDLAARNDLFWLKGYLIFTENIWFGIGPGNFQSYVSVNHSDFTYSNGNIVDQPESGFLLLLCETGIIGSILHLVLLVKVLIHKTIQNNAMPFKLAIIVWIAGFITNYSLSDVKVLFLLILCMSMVFSFNSKNQTLKII